MYKIEINIYASKILYENEQRTASKGHEGGCGIQASLKMGRRKNANHQ